MFGPQDLARIPRFDRESRSMDHARLVRPIGGLGGRVHVEDTIKLIGGRDNQDRGNLVKTVRD